MSFLRILSPARRTPTSQRGTPTLTLRVNDYGLVYLTRVVEPFGPTDLEAGYATEPFSIRGSLQISIPADYGRRMCKLVRVTLRTTCRLAMGPERGWEEDVIWEKVEEAVDVWLEEGSTKFEFAFALPHSFPAMDFHDNAIVRHEVYATVEGTTQSSRFLDSFRPSSPRTSSGRERSPPSDNRHSRLSRSPSPPAESSSWRPDITSIAFDDGVRLPEAPTYEEAIGESSGEGVWLEGTYVAKRNIYVVWNPNPAGGINSLDEKVRDTSKDLGDYEVTFQAPLWSTSCILHTRIHFPHIPPTATIFHSRVELVQSVLVRSPREKPGPGPGAEAKPIRTTRRMLICKEGKRPSKDNERPKVRKAANVEDRGVGEFRVAMRGRLPNDDMARPSTLDGIQTPVHVSHQLLVDIVYSVWNQDRDGRPLDQPGPGDQRTLSIVRSVILPGCTLIPDRVTLPEYASVSTARLARPDQPCPLCGTVPEDRFCTSCKYELPIHPRHDHPPKLVGSADGVCPVCSNSAQQLEGEKRWHNCACAMSLDELKTLAKCIKEAGGLNVVQQWGGEEEDWSLRKEEYERGRQLQVDS